MEGTKRFLVALTICLLVAAAGASAKDEVTAEKRDEKLFLFDVVRFLNDVCAATSRNGTCYTSQECTDKGGTADGSCADGFGVCCTFVMACGGSSSANNSYIVQAATSALTTCSYSVCPVATSVCRIRYDFTSLVLNGPVQGAAVLIGTAPTQTNAGNVGQCTTDGFSISNGMNGGGSPIICGTNTGEHMILDTDGVSCQTTNIYTDSSTTTRSWDIWVTQYLCNEMDMSRAGPSNCLQYFTGKTGIVKSFAFKTTVSATTVATDTHLANQHYTVCIRRESSVKQICWTPIGTLPSTIPTTEMGTYGLSTTSAIKVYAGVSTECSTDYITIPGASTTITPATAPTPTLETSLLHRFCGRFLGTKDSVEKHATICSLVSPFTLGVNFDESEILSTTTKTLPNKSEYNGAPAGILGFALAYAQT